MKAWKEINGGQAPYIAQTISSNGTMGGNSFACASQKGFTDTYELFNVYGQINASTIYGYDISLTSCGGWVSWYYPEPTKITFIVFDVVPPAIETITGTFQASNNGRSWIDLGTFRINDVIRDGYPLEVTDPNFYSYYRFAFTKTYSGSVLTINYITHYVKADAYKLLKQENVRKYYKYQYETFTRPNLTTEGVLGGGSFAVQTNGYVSGYRAYKAVDGNNSTGWECSNYANDAYIFYNPIPLKLTSIKMRNWTGSGRKDSTKGGKVYGSNNGEDWTELVTYTNSDYSSGAEWYISMTSVSSAYTYYKITCTDGTSDSGNYWNIAEMTPIGSEQTVVAGTSSDYDFYKDVTVYSAFDI